MKAFFVVILLLTIIFNQEITGQHSVKSVELTITAGLGVSSYQSGTGATINLEKELPLFSFMVNDTLQSSKNAKTKIEKNSISFKFSPGLSGTIQPDRQFSPGWKAIVTFRNDSKEKQKIENVVPFGQSEDHTYITGTGTYDWPQYLSRSVLFRPGEVPIGVVLPDNAWELGFANVEITDNRSLVAIARRTKSEQAELRRWWAILEPGGSVEYTFYVDEHMGNWRDGLRLMFQQRWLYDLEQFDNTLYERHDLEWIRHCYLMILRFAWDQKYYDAMKSESYFDRDLTEDSKVFGGYDAFHIWPTWPRLGLDQRNQWDLYRDLPGGLAELHRQAEFAHDHGTRYFIAYNPWDQSTRKEDHLKGMAELLRTINADGVILDTRGESSKELQEVADAVKPGVVMYSEGMAVPKHMPGIVAGRVHDAIFMPPPLNLNKFIKPEFAIFRVVQLQEGRLHRELALALFNGYGIELNVMRSGRPAWMDEEYQYLGRVVKILRENSAAFLGRDWQPLLPTTTDSIWVNQWPAPAKTLYTIYSLKPEGLRGPLFEAPGHKDFHYVSLWHHEEIDTVTLNGTAFLPVTVEGFSRFWLGTRREGNVDCIARLPNLLTVRLDHDSLHVSAAPGDKIIISPGLPSYLTKSVELPIGAHTLSLIEHLGRYEGKIVIQLFGAQELLDERVLTIELATPRLISRVESTPLAPMAPPGMVEIPAGIFSFVMSKTEQPNPVALFPDYTIPRTIQMKKFYMDKYPVTNDQFYQFIKATGYQPEDTRNFLNHWRDGKPVKGLETHPVVYVSHDDARAYARWAGKRLPTDIEWQYAAQGTDGRKYPWGNAMDSTRCNNALNQTTPVAAYIDGKSPFGVMDLVGNVWQLTGDIYDNGSYYFGTLRGGSYYNPTSSMWYLKGGPWPVDQHQMLLLVAPGFDRNATVGFRCVKDAG